MYWTVYKGESEMHPGEPDDDKWITWELNRKKSIEDMKKIGAETMEKKNKEKETMNNAVKPNHYKLNVKGIDCEVRDVMQAVMTEEEYDGFLYGNILKYILRAKRKNGKEDLKKAKQYIEWLIEGVEE